jgi:hypothetical protein
MANYCFRWRKVFKGLSQDGGWAEDTGEILDDVLTCANMEILGNGGSKKYYNRLKPSDPLNGKFCTVPIKLTFKTKEERVKAEQSLRKFSKVKCSVPYTLRNSELSLETL